MPRSLRLLIGRASFVAIAAAFCTAGALLIPFLLSVFIAIICTPILFWHQRRRVPNVLAVLSGTDPSVVAPMVVSEASSTAPPASDGRAT